MNTIRISGDGSFRNSRLEYNGKPLKRVKELHLDITSEKQELTLVFLAGRLPGDTDISLTLKIEDYIPEYLLDEEMTKFEKNFKEEEEKENADRT